MSTKYYGILMQTSPQTVSKLVLTDEEVLIYFSRIVVMSNVPLPSVIMENRTAAGYTSSGASFNIYHIKNVSEMVNFLTEDIYNKLWLCEDLSVFQYDSTTTTEMILKFNLTQKETRNLMKEIFVDDEELDKVAGGIKNVIEKQTIL